MQTLPHQAFILFKSYFKVLVGLLFIASISNKVKRPKLKLFSQQLKQDLNFLTNTANLRSKDIEVT